MSIYLGLVAAGAAVTAISMAAAALYMARQKTTGAAAQPCFRSAHRYRGRIFLPHY
ncbi:hypothetical protein HAP94_08410 [Acidithiobacillus ferrivorans]|nr:hypothetical protein [Acidithiobacillus ferrivorans]